MDDIELITVVENEAKDMKLMQTCGGKGGAEMDLFMLLLKAGSVTGYEDIYWLKEGSRVPALIDHSTNIEKTFKIAGQFLCQKNVRKKEAKIRIKTKKGFTSKLWIPWYYWVLAEREGFEPPRRVLTAYSISSATIKAESSGS